jgi:hypothetical protein
MLPLLPAVTGDGEEFRGNFELVEHREDHRVRLWNDESGMTVATFGGLAGDVVTIVFSPNGTRLASCSHETIKLWDANRTDEISEAVATFISIVSIPRRTVEVVWPGLRGFFHWTFATAPCLFSLVAQAYPNSWISRHPGRHQLLVTAPTSSYGVEPLLTELYSGVPVIAKDAQKV